MLLPASVRPLAAEDRHVWADLWQQYLAFYETILPEAIYESTWTRLMSHDEPVWGALALAGHRPIGFAHFIYHRTAWAIADNCYLQDLFVSPDGRGLGHGRGLIAYVAEAAKRNGSSRVYWLTHESNSVAQALYDRVASRSGFIQYRLPPRESP